MVKTPKTRHSKSRREPVTIELEPDAVARVDQPEAVEAAEGPAGAEVPNREATAEQAAEASQPAAEDAIDAHGAPASDSEAAEDDEATQAETGHGDEGADNGDAEPSAHVDARAQAMPSQPSQQKRRAGMALVGAGLIGGAVALAGGGMLQYAGLLGVPGRPAVKDVGPEIADLQAQITALKNAGDGGLGMKVDNLSSTLDQVKADMATLQEAGVSARDEEALSTLDERVAALEGKVAEVEQGGRSAPVELDPINERLAALEALVKSTGDATADREGRLATLEQSISQLSTKVDAQASQPKIALAIAASALKAALDRGGSFAAELDTFAAVSPEAPQIDALRIYADAGVPTRAEIAAEVDAAANAIIAAAEPVADDAGFFQRLLSSAESLVKVRPVGAVAGEGVPETVARMEVAVQRGDYAAALAEYETLPEPAKAAGADFAGKLRARLDVEAAADALISSAMKD